jgi:phosphoglycolate phosphatase
MKELLIFDFDGTLANTEEASYQVYEQMTEIYGVPQMSREALKAFKKKPLKQRIKETGIPYYLLPKIVSESQSKLTKFMKDSFPFEGIPLLLETLSKQYQLIIVSSNHKKIIKKFLKDHQIDVFQKVYGGAALFGKANTIKKAIKKAKSKVKKAIYIGDETRDYQACQELKLDMIAVSWGYEDIDVLMQENIPLIAKTPEDVLAMIGSFHA